MKPPHDCVEAAGANARFSMASRPRLAALTDLNGAHVMRIWPSSFASQPDGLVSDGRRKLEGTCYRHGERIVMQRIRRLRNMDQNESVFALKGAPLLCGAGRPGARHDRAPVSAAWSTSIWPAFTMQSAGTAAPEPRRTQSPGTTSAPSMLTNLPSRFTVASGLSDALSAATACVLFIVSYLRELAPILVPCNVAWKKGMPDKVSDEKSSRESASEGKTAGARLEQQVARAKGALRRNQRGAAPADRRVRHLYDQQDAGVEPVLQRELDHDRQPADSEARVVRVTLPAGVLAGGGCHDRVRAR